MDAKAFLPSGGLIKRHDPECIPGISTSSLNRATVCRPERALSWPAAGGDACHVQTCRGEIHLTVTLAAEAYWAGQRVQFATEPNG
jgi:hypothetical protein